MCCAAAPRLRGFAALEFRPLNRSADNSLHSDHCAGMADFFSNLLLMTC
jgi:hypothetical protein